MNCFNFSLCSLTSYWLLPVGEYWFLVGSYLLMKKIDFTVLLVLNFIILNIYLKVYRLSHRQSNILETSL